MPICVLFIIWPRDPLYYQISLFLRVFLGGYSCFKNVLKHFSAQNISKSFQKPQICSDDHGLLPTTVQRNFTLWWAFNGALKIAPIKNVNLGRKFQNSTFESLQMWFILPFYCFFDLAYSRFQNESDVKFYRNFDATNVWFFANQTEYAIRWYVCSYFCRKKSSRKEDNIRSTWMCTIITGL